MKKFGRRLTAAALALALAAGLAPTAFASWALGSELVARTTQLAEGTALTTQSLWSASKSDLRTEHYITYDPTSGVKPVVFSGNYVASTNSVASAAAQMEAQGYRVVAAVNGGWFNTDGTIVGMLVTDGVVRSLDVENYTLLGFGSDGRAFLDESVIAKSAAWQKADGEAFSTALAGFNAYRHSSYLGGLYLYNRDFSSRVASGGPCVYAVVRPLDGGVMKLNGTLELEVVSVTDTTQEGVSFDGTIPEGCYMLYAEDRDNAALLDALRELTEGRRITVTVGGVSDQWKDAAYGISSIYHPILRGEQITASDLPTTANPYTALGIKADGTVILYTIDGRQSGYSVGATYAQVAERLQELGCVSAVALDGGGSTNLGATLPGTEKFAIVNGPSTSGRRVNNSILLVTDDPGASGMGPGAYVDGKTQVVLAGAKLPVTATAYDGAGLPAPAQPLSWTATGGTIAPGAGNAAVYTAGEQAGSYAISAAASGQGAMPVQIVDGLNSLRVSKEGSTAQLASLKMEPGETVDLTASGRWWNLPVSMGDEDVTWTADPAIGTIDGTGRFIAAGDNGKGNITATAGGKTVTIPVTVDRGDPFVDIAGHWSAPYVTKLYEMELTTGYQRPDGSYEFRPNGQLSRGELVAFLSRLLNVDTDKYKDVALPFADAASIADWVLPHVKAMYALKVFEGTAAGDKVYANLSSPVSREEAMTLLGRVLANQAGHDLSSFGDGDKVSGWARPYVETLVAQGIVEGSDGLLRPKNNITRGEAAKLLVSIADLDKAELTPRPGLDPQPPEQPPEQPPVDPDGPFVTPTERPDYGKDKPPQTIDPDFDPLDNTWLPV